MINNLKHVHFPRNFFYSKVSLLDYIYLYRNVKESYNGVEQTIWWERADIYIFGEEAGCGWKENYWAISVEEKKVDKSYGHGEICWHFLLCQNSTWSVKKFWINLLLGIDESSYILSIVH